jgi:mono/diheme cytochrome c family protein
MRTPIVLALTVTTMPLVAADKEWNPDTTFPALKPADALKTIEVPKGYRLECVASEPMVEEPSMIAFDGDGAMYVCEWRTYMQDEHATGQLDPVSRVVKLRDTDGDGKMDQRTVFIDNAVLPRSVLPMGDRVLVVFTGSTSVWSYFDDNKDGVADRREESFKGEPDNGNIEHQSSGLIWNLDNTVCTNDVRFRYEGGKLVPMPHATGRVSQWGLAQDGDGRLVCSWGGGANPAHSFQLPAGYPIVQLKEHDDEYERPWSACPVWDFSDGGYDVKLQRILTRFSATCGQSVLRSPLFPELAGCAATCEPVGRLVRLSRFTWKDGMGTAHNAFPGSEFIRSSDAYFRPVWTASGPDGGLYVADLYRGIIQEKTWFPTEVENNQDWRDQHQERWVARYHRVKKWGMIKVVRHGRIYRVMPEGGKPVAAPNLLGKTGEALVMELANPDGWWRDTAQMLLVSRGDKTAVPALEAMAKGHADTNARVHALWTLEGLGELKRDVLVAALKHEQPRVRRAAVQLAERRVVAKDAEMATVLTGMKDEQDPFVVTQLYLAFRAAAAAGVGALPESVREKAAVLPVVNAVMDQDRAAALEGPLGETARKGKEVYESLCIACHGVDGKGVKAGDKFLAPKLVESSWFADGGNVKVLARVLLKGQSGPIDGVTYGEGLMPPLETSHSDEQIAAVLTYVGQRWHQWKNPVDPALVAQVRKETAERKQPWTHEELKTVAK